MKKIASIVVLALLAIVFLVWPLFIHAATAGKRKDTVADASIYLQNPNQYLEGSVIDGLIVKDRNRLYTVIRVQPFNTSILFVEDITFCGDEVAKFDVAGPVVITYSRVMHERDCFDLRSVHQIADQKLTGWEIKK